jgi:hypothetical protein
LNECFEGLIGFVFILFCKAAQVSKGWRQVIGDCEILWEALAKRRWIELYRLDKPKLGITWKLLYRTKAVHFLSLFLSLLFFSFCCEVQLK